MRGIHFIQQYPFEVSYKGEVIGEGRVDFLVERKVLLDLKSVETLSQVYVAQMISYLRATKIKLGLVINFNVRLLKEGIKRIAN